jgi:glutamate-1-semialdehyde 2,1-aminomutase
MRLSCIRSCGRDQALLITPFRNMALIRRATSDADVDRHTELFRAAVEELLRP